VLNDETEGWSRCEAPRWDVDNVREHYARRVAEEFRRPIDPAFYADRRLLCQAIMLININESNPAHIKAALRKVDTPVSRWWKKTSPGVAAAISAARSGLAPSYAAGAGAGLAPSYAAAGGAGSLAPGAGAGLAPSYATGAGAVSGARVGSGGAAISTPASATGAVSRPVALAEEGEEAGPWQQLGEGEWEGEAASLFGPPTGTVVSSSSLSSRPQRLASLSHLYSSGSGGSSSGSESGEF
jgi:hypothetical protein